MRRVPAVTPNWMEMWNGSLVRSLSRLDQGGRTTRTRQSNEALSQANARCVAHR